MSDAFHDFDNRLRRINKSRVKMSDGYVSVVGDDGLIVIRPRRRPGRLALKGVVLLFIGCFGFKAAILAVLGQAVYQDRVEKLAVGTTIEQAGAWAMQADPLTVFLSEQIKPYLR